MKYDFSEQDKKVIKTLSLPFDVGAELTEENEFSLLDALMNRFGTDSSESFENVYQKMTEQADRL